MIELVVNGKSVMDLCDDGSAIVKDSNIAKCVNRDINDKEINIKEDFTKIGGNHEED